VKPYLVAAEREEEEKIVLSKPCSCLVPGVLVLNP